MDAEKVENSKAKEGFDFTLTSRRRLIISFLDQLLVWNVLVPIRQEVLSAGLVEVCRQTLTYLTLFWLLLASLQHFLINR